MIASLAIFREHIEERVAAVERDARTAAGLADEAASAAARSLRASEQSGCSSSSAMSQRGRRRRRLQLRVRSWRAWQTWLGHRCGHVAQARARAVLASADVKEGDVVALSAVVGRTQLGSACEAAFATKAARDRARIAVRGLRREYVSGRAVWLDHKQTPAEARAVKIVHKAAEILLELEGSREAPMQVSKDMASRSVMVASRRVLFVSDGHVKWTRDGMARYVEDDREVVSAFAEAA